MLDLDSPKILVISLPGVGDTLNCTPMIDLLRTHYPQARIAVMVMFKSAAELLKGNPQIDEIIFWPFLEKGAWRSLKFMGRIRADKPDVTIVAYPSNRAVYNIVSWLTGAPVRIAHHYNNLYYGSLGFLSTHQITESGNLHNVEQNIRLFSILGGQAADWEKPKIFIDRADREWAGNWIKKKSLDQDLIFGFAPGTAEFKNHARRRWEQDKFIELGRRLVKEFSARILLFGGPMENELKAGIIRGIGREALDVSGTTLLQTAALIKKSRLLITNDSGLMHLAGCLEVPTVAIFGPTNIKWVYPYRAVHRIVSLNLDCSPCFVYSKKPLTCHKYGDYRCITGITVEMVLQGVESLMHTRT